MHIVQRAPVVPVQEKAAGKLTHIHPPALVDLSLVGLGYSGSFHWFQNTDEVDVTATVPVAPHVSEAEEREELCFHSSLLPHLPKHGSGQVLTWVGGVHRVVPVR